MDLQSLKWQRRKLKNISFLLRVVIHNHHKTREGSITHKNNEIDRYFREMEQEKATAAYSTTNHSWSLKKSVTHTCLSCLFLPFKLNGKNLASPIKIKSQKI